MPSPVIITVDGGAASGKSSTSRLIADRFNLLHVDTGSHYRAITYSLLKQGIRADDLDGIRRHLEHLPLGTEVSGHRALIRINNYLPHETELRSEIVNQHVSPFAAVPDIRQYLLNYQRSQADTAVNHQFKGLIIEGRDVGSVIFPDAPIRLFLDADAATRAARRAQEGQNDAIEQRDKIDSGRKTAPLKCPEGAIRIDSSNLTLAEVVAKVAAIIENQTGLIARS